MRGPKLGLRTFLLVILAILLMVFDQHTRYFVKVRSVLSTVVSPLQYVVSAPIDLFAWVGMSVQTHNNLLQENASLQAEQMLLKARLQKLLALEKENNSLRALLQSSPRTGTARVLVAQVLAVDADPFMQQLILDRGSNKGVYVGQPVIDASGVMGQVTSVTPYLSRVMLLSDSRSAIPVESTRNGVRGVVVGRGLYNNMALTHIPATTDIKVGDQLVSSGLGLRYPIGYPVSVINNIQHEPGQPFMNVNVTPSAKLNLTRLVLLVWENQKVLLANARKQLMLIQKEDAANEHHRGANS